MGGVLFVSVMAILIGLKGFTARGLPWSETRRIRGARGRIVGSLCLILGAALYAFAYWGSPPAGRDAIRAMTWGALVGIGGTIAVFRDARGDGE